MKKIKPQTLYFISFLVLFIGCFAAGFFHIKSQLYPRFVSMVFLILLWIGLHKSTQIDKLTGERKPIKIFIKNLAAFLFWFILLATIFIHNW